MELNFPLFFKKIYIKQIIITQIINTIDNFVDKYYFHFNLENIELINFDKTLPELECLLLSFSLFFDENLE